jgi:ATP-dependent Clp protease adaptor protein ClpS
MAESPTTITMPELEAEQRVRQLPPFKVILHNDDVNTVDHVIVTIVKITPLKLQEAVEKTLEAHESGSAVLLVTHRERAELYVEQFASRKLTCTCEPD